ncbi:YhbY family RNA-binding protein [Halorutilales archaeon Cl-col2-1]
MDSDRRQKLKKEAHDLDATLRVGKKGVESVADELSNQLDNSEIVKVKFLRSARGMKETEEVAEELAEAADAKLVETRGNTAVYY